MTDRTEGAGTAREPAQAAFSDEDNPIALDGVEFIEYATSRPQALGQVLEMCGFRPVARHRSREVLLYRQGGINVVVNAHDSRARAGGAAAATDGGPAEPLDDEPPVIAAIAFRVRDARAAYGYLLDRGGWEVPTHPEAMELNIPAIHGPGGSRLYLVDRYREFSIYDIDFVPIPSVDLHPPAVAGIHFFGIVQYIGPGRTADWLAFYDELFGMKAIPDSERFGILPTGTLLRAPAVDPSSRFLWQLIEPHPDAGAVGEQMRRIGLGVPDVTAAVRALRALGMEFLETGAVHTEQRGAITRTYLGGVSFELVHSDIPAPAAAGGPRRS
jgi:4-hydroxyphenylpyruvate dioxygenase